MANRFDDTSPRSRTATARSIHGRAARDGDWWAFGEHKYGDRKALVEREDWEGPAFDTCVKAAWVCKQFESLLRRRLNLAFV